jgi:DNA (cytosine-5)-methyltransferase 1
LIPFGGNNTSGPIDVATACNAHGGSMRSDFETETFCVEVGTSPLETLNRACGGRYRSASDGGMVNSPVVFESRFARNGRGAPDGIAPPLKARSGDSGRGDGAPLLATCLAVRRLTVRECERLQGFPDDYTLIPYRGKPAADGPRYRAIGNSMAVPVMRWIGRRIQRVEGIRG